MKTSSIPLLLLLALSGCAKPTLADRVTVSGTVSFDGKPVTGGSIRFVSEVDPMLQIHGRIRNDGTFTLSSAPVGRVLAAVETASVLEGVDSPDRGIQVKLPHRYARPETSKLAFDIPESGMNDLKIVLSP